MTMWASRIVLRLRLFAAGLRYVLRDPWPDEAAERWAEVEKARAAIAKLKGEDQ